MEKAEKDWAKYAKDFDKLQSCIVGEEVMALLKEEFDKLVDLGYLLELGCGNGTYTMFIEHAADRILATDCSAAMVNEAKKKLDDMETVQVQEMNCYDIQQPDATFDSVLMANVIHVVADPLKAIQEIRRVLKPNGTLVITSFTADGMSFFSKMAMIYRYLTKVGKPPTSGTRFSKQSLTEFVTMHGFEVMEAKLIGRTSKAINIIAKKRGELVVSPSNGLNPAE